MNSRERMITVLEHKLPDRVPLAEYWIDAKVVNAILPESDAPKGHIGTVNALPKDSMLSRSNQMVEYLDMDVVTVPTMIYEHDEVEWVDEEKRIFRDKWGALQMLTQDAIPIPTKPAHIETEEDLARYKPPDPGKSPVIGKVRELKKRYPNGEKAIAVVGESGWAPGVYLRGGLENFLLDFALRPDFIKDIMQLGTDYYCDLYKMVIPAGADIVLLGDDYSDKNGPMISPAQFEEIVLPCDAKVVSAVKKAGGYCIKHTDGDIRKIMDSLVGTGLDCLGPLEPVPGMELDSVLKRYPGKISVMGNISVDLLSRGSVEDIVKATKHLLTTVSSIGPHIMSSGNTIASSVKPENFLAMVNTVREFGKYPTSM